LEQPKKPGANRDIADLKARLGLLKAPGAAASPAPGGAPAPAPFPTAAPAGSSPFPTSSGAPSAGARMSSAGMAAIPSSAPPAHDPFAAMKPPAGRTFDLRAVDDGAPVANVRSRGGKAALVIGGLLLVAGASVGYGFGAVAVGRRAYNNTNAAAKKVKAEVDDMQKTVAQIGTAIAMSQQRLTAEKKDVLAWDPRLIEDLEKVKLEPRPDTTRIFKVDYYRMKDFAVDRLMSYYYDTVGLYNEVEKHIKRSRADKDSLDVYATKQGGKAGTYGVVFDSQNRLVVGQLVEMGNPVCKGGTAECPPDQVEGFQIRANTGQSWSNRKLGSKLAGDIVVPIQHQGLYEALTSGSPDQVRNEQYRQRFQNIRILLARLTAEKKELFTALDEAAARPDLTTF
jgi:hypothetical protein